MASKTKMFSCRLSDDDFESLHANAAALDLAPSAYVRHLVRIPAAAASELGAARVLVLDAKSLGLIRHELLRWGRHYNQGVHALNSIAYAARRKGLERDYFSQRIAVAEERLGEVDEGLRRLEERLDALEGSIVVGENPCRY